jgi:streptogramin lyase
MVVALVARTAGWTYLPKRGAWRLVAVAWLLVVAVAFASEPASSSPARSQGRPASRGAGPTVDYFFIPTGSSNPRSIAVGPDGNLWFGEADGNRIGRITPKGVISEFRIGRSKNPYGITAGSDGNLWFTERTGNKIAAISTAGTLLHEYAVPSSDAQPYDIAAGPDGNLWFTENNSSEDAPDNIGRVTPGGDMEEIPLSTCICFPFGITTGPDGNIWASEELGATPEMEGGSYGTVDRVTSDGKAIDRFAVSTTEAVLPSEVAAGPDGNVWFGEISGERHSVGRVTPAGVVTEFVIPATNASTPSIATGPDGRIWLTKSSVSEDFVVILRPDGSFVRELPVHPTPLSLTIGPDGNMWFVASQDNEVGRIHTAQTGHKYVIDIAPGFAPFERVAGMGKTVDWIFEAPGNHSVHDATGMALFDSGPLPPVSFFSHVFTAAGSYRVRDRGTGPYGVIAVHLEAATHGTVGHGVPLTWATVPAPAGFVYDVQVRLPGHTSWTVWKAGVTARAGSYVPHDTGHFAFRARLRKVAGGQAGYSPLRLVAVTAG